MFHTSCCVIPNSMDIKIDNYCHYILYASNKQLKDATAKIGITVNQKLWFMFMFHEKKLNQNGQERNTRFHMFWQNITSCAQLWGVMGIVRPTCKAVERTEQQVNINRNYSKEDITAKTLTPYNLMFIIATFHATCIVYMYCITQAIFYNGKLYYMSLPMYFDMFSFNTLMKM